MIPRYRECALILFSLAVATGCVAPYGPVAMDGRVGGISDLAGRLSDRYSVGPTKVTSSVSNLNQSGISSNVHNHRSSGYVTSPNANVRPKQYSGNVTSNRYSGHLKIPSTAYQTNRYSGYVPRATAQRQPISGTGHINTPSRHYSPKRSTVTRAATNHRPNPNAGYLALSGDESYLSNPNPGQPRPSVGYLPQPIEGYGTAQKKPDLKQNEFENFAMTLFNVRAHNGDVPHMIQSFSNYCGYRGGTQHEVDLQHKTPNSFSLICEPNTSYDPAYFIFFVNVLSVPNAFSDDGDYCVNFLASENRTHNTRFSDMPNYKKYRKHYESVLKATKAHC